MAKTKQTAKKSTGGSAKRKLIGYSERALRSHSAQSRKTSHSPKLTPDAEMIVEPTTSSAPMLVEPLGSGQVVGKMGAHHDDDTDHVSDFTFQITAYSPLTIPTVVPHLF